MTNEERRRWDRRCKVAEIRQTLGDEAGELAAIRFCAECLLEDSLEPPLTDKERDRIECITANPNPTTEDSKWLDQFYFRYPGNTPEKLARFYKDMADLGRCMEQLKERGWTKHDLYNKYSGLSFDEFLAQNPDADPLVIEFMRLVKVW